MKTAAGNKTEGSAKGTLPELGYTGSEELSRAAELSESYLRAYCVELSKYYTFQHSPGTTARVKLQAAEPT